MIFNALNQLSSTRHFCARRGGKLRAFPLCEMKAELPIKQQILQFLYMRHLKEDCCNNTFGLNNFLLHLSVS